MTSRLLQSLPPESAPAGSSTRLPTGNAGRESSSERGGTRWLADLAALLLLASIAVALLWPLPLHPASTLPDLGDPLDSAWRLAWPVHQLRADPRHLLNANIFYPVRTTYLFDELLLGVAILTAPIILAGGSGVLAFNSGLLFAFAANGWSMYALGRYLVGNRLAALGGALVFMAAPFRFQHVGHLGLSSAYWMPLALLFLDRLWVQPSWRRALPFGAAVAFQALSAQYYGFQVAIVTGLFVVFIAIRHRGAPGFGPFLLGLLLATLFAELLLFPIVAPYAGVKGTWNYSRGLAENELYSATLSSFLAAPPQTIIGARLAATLRALAGASAWNVWLYPGVGAVVVALAGLTAGKSRAKRALNAWFFLLLAFVGAAMTLGPTLYAQGIGMRPLTTIMPYRLFFAVIPVFDAMRAPERFGNVLLLGLAGAVTWGIATLVGHLPNRGRPYSAVLTGLLLVSLATAEYARTPLAVAQVPPMPPVYAWLAAQPPAPALELPYGPSTSQLNREQTRQYWSTFHWQKRVNGSSDITPLVFDSLRRDLDSFPDARTLGILQALGVRYVITHRAELTAPGWEARAGRYASHATTLVPRGQFGSDLAYELRPDDRFVTLRAAIPPGATVFLSGADPVGTDTYMATIAYLLRDHRLITRIVPTFGVVYERPTGGIPAQFAVLYRGENPSRYNFPLGGAIVYEDNLVQIYAPPAR